MIDARFGRLDVTPEDPVPLAGFAGRQKPYVSVSAPLEVNAALLQHRGRALLILSGDFLYFSGTLRDQIVARLGPRLGLRASDVLLAASHTHFAPSLDPTKPQLGSVDPLYARGFEERLLSFLDRLANTASVGVAVRHARVESRHNTNRRVMILDANEQPAVNLHLSDPGGPCDPRLDVLRFDDDRGEMQCAVVRYACHPTASTPANSVSPDFPGVIRSTLREHARQEDLPVLFLQGFAGQLRPEAEAARAGGSPATPDIGLEPVPRSTFTEGLWMRWAKSLAADACATLDDAATAPTHPPALSSEERSIPLDALIDGLPAGHERTALGLQVMTLGPGLLVVALSAEPTSDWSERLGDLLPGITVLTVGYANQVFGYLPTAREAVQGGYEVAGFMRSFGLAGSFAPDFADRVQREVAALVAPFAGAADANALAEHLSVLRKTIDRLLSERDHMRARMLQERAANEAAVKLAQARLAGVEDRAEQLSAAAANLREQLRAARAAAESDCTRTKVP